MNNRASKKTTAGTNDIEFLINKLASKDGMIRWRARELLVRLGKPAVPHLIQALQDSKLDRMRWEAAKALGEIGDARAIPSLVKTLDDSDQDVVWLAAEALRKFEKAAWPELLRELIDKPDSVALCQAVHHVLRNQNEPGYNDLLTLLRKALESVTASESASAAAYAMLERMKAKS